LNQNPQEKMAPQLEAGGTEGRQARKAGSASHSAHTTGRAIHEGAGDVALWCDLITTIAIEID
jgi:hypothetical protein